MSRRRVSAFRAGARLVGALALGAAGITAAATAEAPRAALDVRCAGSAVHATVLSAPGQRVRSVVFTLAPAGVDREDRAAPFEIELDRSEQIAGRLRVFVTAEFAGGATEDYERSIARCAKRVGGRPPSPSPIVEGLSTGGVEIGMWPGKVEERWTTSPSRSSRCSERAPRLPRYRRWKTARGIGLGSPVSALTRAYGRQLRRVPFPKRNEPGDEDPYYVVTVRGNTRWTTVFHVALAKPRANTPPPPRYEGDRVAWIEILSGPALRHSYAPYARRSWRP